MSGNEEPHPATLPCLKMDRRPLRMSLQAPACFAMGMDLNWWLTRFKLYTQGAGIPKAEWKAKLLPILDDKPFRVVNQLGLVDSGNYADVKASLVRKLLDKMDAQGVIEPANVSNCIGQQEVWINQVLRGLQTGE